MDFDKVLVLLIVGIAAAQAGFKCNTGEEWYGEGAMCYKHFDNEVKFGDAKKACKAEGGRLAIVDTPEKASFIQAYFDDLNGWIGGRVDFEDGSVAWLNEDSTWPDADGFVAAEDLEDLWVNDEPQDDKNQCGRLRIMMDAEMSQREYGYGEGWDAAWCKRPFPYYCEKK